MTDDKNLGELSMIEGTAFWKFFSKRIDKYYKATQNQVRNCPLDKIERTRGVLDGLDFILSLPREFTRGPEQIVEEELDNG
jgi:hypothetical protein